MNQAFETAVLRADAFELITPDPRSAPGHFVQFYEDDNYLCDIVAEFLFSGLLQNQPILMLATSQHRALVCSRLAARGFDLEQAQRSGQVALLDAHAVLADIMVDSLPDEQRFRAALLPLVRQAAARGQRVRAFGGCVVAGR